MHTRYLPLILSLGAALSLGACSDKTPTPAEQQAQETAPPAAVAPAPKAADETLTDKAKKLAADTQDLGGSAWEATKQKTSELVDRSKEVVDSTSETTGDVVEEVKEKSVNAYETLKEKTSEVYETTKEKASDAIDAAKEKLTPEKTPSEPAPVIEPRKI